MDDAVVYASAALVPVRSLGRDGQGRELVTCPGCQEPATVEADGTIRCGWCDAMRERFTSLIAGTLG
jgi:hypothetical protein